MKSRDWKERILKMLSDATEVYNDLMEKRERWTKIGRHKTADQLLPSINKYKFLIARLKTLLKE